MALPTTNLVARWIAGTGVTASGGRVSSWVDTVNSYDATQSSAASKPVDALDSASRPVMSFPQWIQDQTPQAAKTFFNLPAGLSFAISDCTVWVVGTTCAQNRQVYLSHSTYSVGLLEVLCGTAVISRIRKGNATTSSLPSVPLNRYIIGSHNASANHAKVMDSASLSADLGSNAQDGMTFSSGFIGRDGGDNYYVQGNIYEILIYAGHQSDEDIAATRDYLKTEYDVVADADAGTEYTDGQIVFEGDSITKGTGSAANASYPAILLESIPNWKGMCFASPGNLISHLTDRAALVDSVLDSDKYAANVLMLLVGRNDCSAAEASTVYSNLVTYCTARVAAGWEVWVGTVLASGDATAGPRITTLNGLIRGTSGNGLIVDAGVNRIIDFAAHAAFDPDSAGDTTYYTTDETHPNSTGYAAMAGIIADEFGGSAGVLRAGSGVGIGIGIGGGIGR